MKKLVAILSLLVISISLYAEKNYVYVRPISGIVYYSCGNGDWDYIEKMYLWRNVISDQYVITESPREDPNNTGYYYVYENTEEVVSGVNVRKYKYYSQKGWCLQLYYN